MGTTLACCPVCLDFRCNEAVQYNCHSGVGWIIIKNADGVEIYNGCPSGNVLEISCSSKLPLNVEIEYNHCEGPCAGSHICNRAIFDLYLASCDGESNCDQFLGTVNLNNEGCTRGGSGGGGCGDCCDECYRYGGNFSITESQLGTLRSCLASQTASARSPRPTNFSSAPDPEATNLAP